MSFLVSFCSATNDLTSFLVIVRDQNDVRWLVNVGHRTENDQKTTLNRQRGLGFC